MHSLFTQGWCAGRDLNPHGISTTSPSNSRVCLFHHPRVADDFYQFGLTLSVL
jgi:hypothetical protein